MTGNNVFISFKYGDSNVFPTPTGIVGNAKSTNDYVQALKSKISISNKIRDRSEDLGEDLSKLDEKTIESILADKIFYTSVTIVLISANMYDRNKAEKYQWIPWEISYSLKEKSRQDTLSHHNAIVAVVIPDRNGSYRYAIVDNECCSERCVTIQTNNFFKIIGENMFNHRKNCPRSCEKGKLWQGESSYIEIVKWSDFVGDIQKYVDKAIQRKNNINEYNIVKKLT